MNIENVDLRTLKRGNEVEFKGTTFIVSDIDFRRGGWVRVLATLDGEHVALLRRCSCVRPLGEIPVIDLVTESEYLCCAHCRREVDD